MFIRKQSQITVKLDEVIDAALLELSRFTPDQKEYAQALDQVVKLNQLKKDNNPSQQISYDTLAVVAGNLLGIVMIVGHERASIVTSKALGFVMKAAR